MKMIKVEKALEQELARFDSLSTKLSLMQFDAAVECYMKVVNNGIGTPMQPSKALSSFGNGSRWVLRNNRGFLAYVTLSGKVLNHRFQELAA